VYCLLFISCLYVLFIVRSIGSLYFLLFIVHLIVIIVIVFYFSYGFLFIVFDIVYCLLYFFNLLFISLIHANTVSIVTILFALFDLPFSQMQHASLRAAPRATSITARRAARRASLRARAGIAWGRASCTPLTVGAGSANIAAMTGLTGGIFQVSRQRLVDVEQVLLDVVHGNTVLLEKRHEECLDSIAMLLSSLVLRLLHLLQHIKVAFESCNLL
jgi:hypothetical protein